MPGKPGDESILYVNGDARQQPTFSLLPDIECKLLLELAEDHVVTGKCEIFLEHYLSYSVPVIQN